MNQERLGEIRTNTFGTQMKIIRYNKASDIDVEFLDNHHYIKRNTTYSNFTKGQIMNPFDPTIWGVGYIGVGKYPTSMDNGKRPTPIYAIWSRLIERCYSPKAAERFPAYYGVTTVCEEWHNYQNFAQWYEDNQYETEGRLHLDKDILYPGNKMYSPYHCVLVPQRINMLFMNKPNKRGLPNGIRKEGNKYYAKYDHKELGSSDTLIGAYELYIKEKKRIIIEVAKEYKNRIPDILYDAMLRYEFRIENDKNM